MSVIRENLVNILDTLIINTRITNSSLITEDGLVIASNSEQNKQDEEKSINFAALSASILSMAERGIEIINSNKILEQIKIDAGLNERLEADFTILITRIFSNILIQVIFPKEINIGLVHFEINKTIKKIKTIIQDENAREMLFSSLGSLL
ncbi:MAG: roadblock/LC7 domain-containing protein [Candidatus Hermodarchaeota archaeon]